jgi:hypothetical protein
VTTGAPRVELAGGLRLCVNEFLTGPDCHLFNLPEFFRLHAPRGGFYCQLLAHDARHACAAIHFTPDAAGVLRSPLRGTYGGISADADLAPELVDEFLRAVERAIAPAGAADFEVLLAPAAHDPLQHARDLGLFLRLGYTVHVEDRNFELAVESRPLVERMASGNRKRFNKCLREGFAARRLEAAEYARAFDLIAHNRERRGFPVTMRFPDIMTMVDVFGGRVRCFAIFRDADMVAAAICMLVRRDVLYVFYWGDAGGMQQYSPVVLLASEIHDHCRQQGIRLLDIGTGTSGGVPNEGLIRFKHGLGCSESAKLTLRKERTVDA